MLNRNSPAISNIIFWLSGIIFFTALTSFSPFSKPDLAKEVLKYTNQYRKSRGLSSLELREDLCAIARKHSTDMAAGRKRLGHAGFRQREVLIRRKLNTSGMIGENVAFGAYTGKEVVSIWKNSAPHRRNMLGNFKYIGIGTARDRRGNIYFTQIFVR